MWNGNKESLKQRHFSERCHFLEQRQNIADDKYEMAAKLEIHEFLTIPTKTKSGSSSLSLRFKSVESSAQLR